jgi:hypothetical protein
MNIREADQAQTISCSDASDLVEIELSVVVDIGRENEASALFDKQHVGTAIVAAGAQAFTGREINARANLSLDERTVDHGCRSNPRFQHFETVRMERVTKHENRRLRRVS